MTGFTGSSLQLHSIVTAYNQWLSTTRFIPCWTTSVFSSTVTNNERRIPAHSLNCLEGRLSHEWILKRVHGSLYMLVGIHGHSFITKTCLLKRSLLSNRGSIVSCVTMGMCLAKCCPADCHIPSQYCCGSYPTEPGKHDTHPLTRVGSNWMTLESKSAKLPVELTRSVDFEGICHCQIPEFASLFFVFLTTLSL
jgi:hypothetical protein